MRVVAGCHDDALPGSHVLQRVQAAVRAGVAMAMSLVALRLPGLVAAYFPRNCRWG